MERGRHVDRHLARLRQQLAGADHDLRRPPELPARGRARRARSSCPTSRRRSRPPSDDGKNYIFKVRKGIKYSTGGEVKPSDFTYTFERQFKAAAPASNFYQGIVGGDACAKKPKECDLSKGVVADDAASTVTFHLKEPDPDFLQKLAIPFAYVVQKGTPNKDIGTKPLPATGPYMIQEYVPDQRMVFVRNPNFKEWSREAQPDGYPDKILMKLGLSISDAVTQIENGQADWSYDAPPADRLGEIGDKYKDQFHINPVPQNYHMAINTRVAPFNKVEVRQALNFATDRNAVLQLWGGKALGKISCQILPFNFPGNQPYCPYTKNPGDDVDGARHGEGAAARRPVRHQGPEGRADLDPGRDVEVDQPLLRLAAEQARLQGEHQDAQLVGPVLLRAGLARTRRSSRSRTGIPTTRRRRTS